MWIGILRNVRDADQIVFNNKAQGAISDLFAEYLEKRGTTRSEVLGIVKELEKNFAEEKFDNDQNEFQIKSKIIKKFIEELEKRFEKILKAA